MPDRALRPAVWLAAGLLSLPVPVLAQDGLAIGYMLDHPLPLLAGRDDAAFNAAIGPGTTWTAFDNQAQLVAALSGGEIGVAIGLDPEGFLDAVNSGAPVRLIDIAATETAPVLCTLRHDIAESAASLYGLTVALDYGSVSEWLFEAEMQALKADLSSPVRRNLASPDAAAALGRGDAGIACGTIRNADRLLESGADLMDGLPGTDPGLRWFQGIVVSAQVAESSQRQLTSLLYGQGDLAADPAAIAAVADLGEIDTEAALSRQVTLSEAQKLSPDWFDGGLQAFLTSLAELRHKRGLFDADTTLAAASVDDSFLASPG